MAAKKKPHLLAAREYLGEKPRPISGPGQYKEYPREPRPTPKPAKVTYPTALPPPPPPRPSNMPYQKEIDYTKEIYRGQSQSPTYSKSVDYQPKPTYLGHAHLQYKGNKEGEGNKYNHGIDGRPLISTQSRVGENDIFAYRPNKKQDKHIKKHERRMKGKLFYFK